MSINDWSILLGQPHNGMVCAASADSVRMATSKLDVRAIPSGPSSLLANGFNWILCEALNDESCTHLAFLHGDLAPQWYWVDVLAEEMDRTGVDFISAVAAIKDERGLTSTGVAHPEVTWSSLRRFTTTEMMELPETFFIEDTLYPNCILLHNSGCWLADLRSPVFKQMDGNELMAHFEIRDRIICDSGRFKAQVEPEDWFFSRKLHELGANTCVTRKVVTKHYGNYAFRNDYAWGLWKEDEQTRAVWEQVPCKEGCRPSKLIHERGYWLDDIPDGELFDEPLAEAISDTVSEKVVDVGCGKGKYVDKLLERGHIAWGFDGNPKTEEYAIACSQADLSTPLEDLHGADWALCLEVGEHIPQEYEQAFLDNVAHFGREGVVMSWAAPGQPGAGHVNCRDQMWVMGQMMDRGYQADVEATNTLRDAATLPYFKENLIVFRRRG